MSPAAGNIPGPQATAPPGLPDLLLAFATIAICGFGGVLPWARRIVVEQRRWMTAEEFNEAFALSQFLPGPNVVNFSIVFGARIRGVAGAAVALAGLLGPPVLIVTALGILYVNYGEIAWLQRVLGAIASAAAGLIVAAVAKMAQPVFRKPFDFAPAVAVAAFVAVGLLRWPLPSVLAVLVPVSIALAWMRR